MEKYHIPPTKHYMDLVIQGAYSFGLSMMWISYLQSFSTQVGRKATPAGLWRCGAEAVRDFLTAKTRRGAKKLPIEIIAALRVDEAL